MHLYNMKQQVWAQAPKCNDACMHMHCDDDVATTLRLFTTPEAALASPMNVCRNAAHGRERESALQLWHGHRYLASPFDGEGNEHPTLAVDMDRNGTAFFMDLSSPNGIALVDCSGRRLAVLARNTSAAVGFLADAGDLGDDCWRWVAHNDQRPNQAGAMIFRNALSGEYLVIK